MGGQSKNPKAVVVLGAGGMLGRRLVDESEARGWTVHGFTRAEADITDPSRIAAILAETGADVVFNAAAWTDVDGAEAEEAAATRVNGAGPRVLAEACRDAGSALFHVSTDYVFDGGGSTPYRCEAPLEPVNAYGRSKAAGERAIAEVAGASGWDRFIIARTSWLYDRTGRNFLTTIRALAEDRDRIEVVDDQRGRPTAAPELARQLCGLVEVGVTGMFHCCNDGEATWCDLARAVVAAHGLECRVEPCGSDRFPRPARRPAYSVLDLFRTREVLGRIPHWEESLADVVGSSS
ncbi:MAG: dTDP-4-dehydrorhamnose reductase [Planctomycetota bacterium]|jgi:dTDP-4-dehydrorhamnose reductase